MISSERSLRHVTNVLTYPYTIAGVLHENSPYNLKNRLTIEGLTSMAGNPPPHITPTNLSNPNKCTPPGSPRNRQTERNSSQHPDRPNIHPRRPRRILPPPLLLGTAMLLFLARPLPNLHDWTRSQNHGRSLPPASRHRPPLQRQRRHPTRRLARKPPP